MQHFQKAGEGSLKFTLSNGLLNRVNYKLVIPVVAKRLLGPDLGLDNGLQAVLAAFAHITDPKMPIVAPRNSIFNSVSADITVQGFHKQLLMYQKICDFFKTVKSLSISC
jgi:hypothetical protein